MSALMDKRVAIVTGANRGIGLEICRQLARRGGIRVMLTARNETRGMAAAGQLRAEGLEVDFHDLDVTSEKSIRTIAGWLETTCKRCDILINNAGILADPRGSRFLDSRPATYRQTLETNVFGPLLLSQALVPLMKKNGYGRIVNVSSAQGQLSDMGVGTPAYRISKTASPSHGDGWLVTNALIRRKVSFRRWEGPEVYSPCQ